MKGTQTDALHPQVPDIPGPVGQWIQICGETWERILLAIKQQKTDSRGMATEYSEIDTSPALVCPKWQGHTNTNVISPIRI
jgi:hypothetical protein